MATTRRARPTATSTHDRPSFDLTAASDALVGAQRVALIATVAVCLLVFLRGTNDSFGTPKVTAVFVGTIVILALGAVRALRARALLVPAGPTPWFFGGFAAVLVALALVHRTGMVAALGPYTRYEGYLPYLCYVALTLTVVRIADGRWLVNLVRWLAAVLGAVVLYGLVQVVSLDPFDWSSTGGHHAFSTLGQENFAAGVVACLLPLAIGAAVLTRSSVGLRRVWIAIAVGAVIIVWRANSFQGPVAAIPAVMPLAAVTLGGRLHSRATGAGGARNTGAWLAAATAAVVGFVVLLGPNLLRGTWSQLRAGTDERRYLWNAAITLFKDHPVLGGGFGWYARQFGEARPKGHAVHYGALWSDAPHSVPLGMLVSGGVVLFAAYLAVLAFVAWCLMRGLLRLRGDERIVLAIFGGGWIAYLVQSLVSIDVPPVAILPWIFAGAIIYLGGWRHLRIVGPASADPGRRSGAARIAEVVVMVVAVVAGWYALMPLRADYQAGVARDAHSHFDNTTEVRAATSAVGLAPWEPTYLSQLASGYERDNRKAQALQVGARAAGLDTGRPTSALATADLALTMNDNALAKRWFAIAIGRDPYFGGGYDAAGKFYGQIGDRKRSVVLLAKAARYSPQNGQYWRDYGQALAGIGRLDDAIKVLQHSLRIEPSNDAPTLIAEIRKAQENQRP